MLVLMCLDCVVTTRAGDLGYPAIVQEGSTSEGQAAKQLYPAVQPQRGCRQKISSKSTDYSSNQNHSYSRSLLQIQNSRRAYFLLYPGQRTCSSLVQQGTRLVAFCTTAKMNIMHADSTDTTTQGTAGTKRRISQSIGCLGGLQACLVQPTCCYLRYSRTLLVTPFGHEPANLLFLPLSWERRPPSVSKLFPRARSVIGVVAHKSNRLIFLIGNCKDNIHIRRQCRYRSWNLLNACLQ
jgi:hypothetical protein